MLTIVVRSDELKISLINFRELELDVNLASLVVKADTQQDAGLLCPSSIAGATFLDMSSFFLAVGPDTVED